MALSSISSSSSGATARINQISMNAVRPMSTFTDLFKKAHDAINNLRGGNHFFLGKDGDIVYSKNNVCVHDIVTPEECGNGDANIVHTPGYLTIHCQSDDTIGVTLVLQWLPNTTLQKNPASIRSVSPRNHEERKNQHHEKTESSDNEEGSTCTEDDTSIATNATSPDIHVEMNGDVITVTSIQERPCTLNTKTAKAASLPQKVQPSGGLGIPAINLIPNTPVDHRDNVEVEDDEHQKIETVSQSSLSTSGADELSDREELQDSSSCDNSDDERDDKAVPILDKYRAECAALWSSTPEQFALDHDLILTDSKVPKDEGSVAIARGRAMYNSKTSSASLFSVNLGNMRTMRLFYSNQECTSGQMVIASHDSHYKILHFHHGGLDKLAQLFEQWSSIKARSIKDGSPSPLPDRHLLICQPAIHKNELDPEDGLYDKVSWDFWRSYKSKDGAIDDSHTIRKAIYFASMEPGLRKEIWPFLLRVYPWESTVEQRESIRNDLFLEYQNIRKKTMKKTSSCGKTNWHNIENTIVKDVVRTDRKNPYFEGDDNPHIEVMKNILLNYAAVYPDVNYIQGMSDLLAPLLSTIRDESDTYWCFSGLMQQTLFASSPKTNENLMELNLEYLRELVKFLVPDVFNYFSSLGADSLQFMFVHRWILLFFKREFPEADALHIWEACWARYRTQYFHLFICVAIVSIYGPDVISQRLPHDEILLYFSSLAMHMDARVVLKKARGLLYAFVHKEKVPCTLAGVCEQGSETDQWDSHRQPQAYICVQIHGNHEPCPFI